MPSTPEEQRQRREQQRRAEAASVGLLAPGCRCPNPITYRDEDGDRHCHTCGRGVRP